MDLLGEILQLVILFGRRVKKTKNNNNKKKKKQVFKVRYLSADSFKGSYGGWVKLLRTRDMLHSGGVTSPCGQDCSKLLNILLLIHSTARFMPDTIKP